MDNGAYWRIRFAHGADHLGPANTNEHGRSGRLSNDCRIAADMSPEFDNRPRRQRI
jgi:hypothetical protein